MEKVRGKGIYRLQRERESQRERERGSEREKVCKEEKEREASIASDAVIPQTSVLFHENTWYLQTKLTTTI